MGIKINDEKMKERIKESKKNDNTKKISTTKENTEKKNNKETKEEDNKKNPVKKDDGTYKYRPFEIFFNKKKEEKNETKTE